MNKKFLFNLVKIANDLDKKGLVKEANIVDNVLIKIAQGTGKKDYQKDILEYKKLILSKQFTKAEEFLDSVAQKYTDIPTRDAFLSQALRIQNENQNVNYNQDTLSNQDLYKLIKNYHLDQANNLEVFNGNWSKMVTYLQSINKFTPNVQNILNSAYTNLTAKFQNRQIPFGSNVTGDYDKDIQLYATLINNNLSNKAQELLDNVLKSEFYNQNYKEAFELDANRYRISLDKNNFDKKGGKYTAVNDETLSLAINYFKINESDTLAEFNQRWGQLINYFNTHKFDEQVKDQSATNMYEYPVVKQQLDLLKQKILLFKKFPDLTA